MQSYDHMLQLQYKQREDSVILRCYVKNCRKQKQLFDVLIIVGSLNEHPKEQQTKLVPNLPTMYNHVTECGAETARILILNHP